MPFSIYEFSLTMSAGHLLKTLLWGGGVIYVTLE